VRDDDPKPAPQAGGAAPGFNTILQRKFAKPGPATPPPPGIPSSAAIARNPAIQIQIKSFKYKYKYYPFS